MLAATEEKRRSLRTWGGCVLYKQRIKAGLSYEEMYIRLGSDKKSIKDWEMNLQFPSILQLKRLYDMLPNLRYFNDLLPRILHDQIISRAYAASNNGVELWIPPSVTPEDFPVEDDFSQITFGEALGAAIADSGLHHNDLCELINTDTAHVQCWIDGRETLNAETHAALLGLFPELELAPYPGTKDITPPPFIARQDMGKIIELRANEVTAIEKVAPTSPIIRIPKKSEIEAASIRYSKALIAKRHADKYLEDLEHRTGLLKEEMVELEDELSEAEKLLLSVANKEALEKLVK